MKKYTIFYALFFVVSNQAFAQLSCTDLFGQSKKQLITSEEYLNKNLNNEDNKVLIENWIVLDNLDHDLITGKKSPTWHDFEVLSNVEKRMREMSEEKLKVLHDAISQFDLSVNKTVNKRESQKSAFPDNNMSYGPTDYGLRLAYLEKLQSLNQFLPKKLKFIKYKIPADLKKNQINVEARELVSNLEKMHDAFMQNEGFKSHEELVQKIKLSDEEVQKAHKFLESDELDFAMLRPVNGRFWIEKIGFHNQYVTKSSKGYMGDVGRQAAEGSYINEKYDSYSKRDDDFKPKYGFLKPKPESKLQGTFPHYGEDLYFFEKSNLKDRVTFTIGDSLNALARISRWNWGRDTEIYHPERWDHLFTPWSRHDVIAPFIAEYIKFNSLQIGNSNASALGQDKSNTLTRAHSNSEYLELQYWGALTLENVKAFAFTTEPPSGDFLKKLLEHKITIYDYTDRHNYKIWKP